jgi:GDP-D-mannose dehydratase
MKVDITIMTTDKDKLFLVTGATGQTGDPTARLLLDRGYRVRGQETAVRQRLCTE